MGGLALSGSKAKSDDERPRFVLDALAGQERDARMAGGYALLLTGAGLTAAGLVADLQFEEDWAPAFWITGIALAGTSIFTFVIKGPLESLAVETAASSPAERQRIWADKARSARTGRYVGSGIGFTLGAASLIGGGVIAAGAGDLDDDEQEGWTVSLLLVGGAFAAGGVAGLIIESPLETAYRAAYGSSFDAPSLQVGLAPVRGGAALSLHGAF